MGLESSLVIARRSHETMVASAPVDCPSSKVLWNGDIGPLVMRFGTPHACHMTNSRMVATNTVGCYHPDVRQIDTGRPQWYPR
jgi:hypothetical protein